MDSNNKSHKKDVYRYGNDISWHSWVNIYLWLFRKCSSANNILLRKIYIFFYKIHSKKHGFEIPWYTKIGEGLYIGHPYNITINGQCILGKNINIHKGVSIGQENRGIRKGVPTIGNNVYIGINALICGNIKIGNNVFIAANSFVNCNVPDNSIVLGNPCKIIHSDNATEGYIINTV